MNPYQFTVQSNWDVILKDSASKVFGHRTKKAQEYVFAGKDFHKSYQLVYSFTEAGVKVCKLYCSALLCGLSFVPNPTRNKLKKKLTINIFFTQRKM